MNKKLKWQEWEDAILRERYRFGVDALVEVLNGRTRRSIVLRARRLNLDGYSWTEAEDEVIRIGYAECGASYCQTKLPHRSLVAIRCRALRLGVRRDMRKRNVSVPDGEWQELKNFMLYGKRGEIDD